MQRMRSGESRPKFPRHRAAPELSALCEEAACWARDHFAELRELGGRATSLAAEELDDRARDNWHPLMAIAYAAGGGWEERAHQASLILSDTTRDTELLIELLHDIRQVFDEEEVDALPSVTLVQKLVALETSPWKELRLTASQLSRRLRPVRIRPRQLWIDAGMSRKSNKQGYERAQFEDAFSRYLL